jgi:uncharacterized membrane-anchored protein
MSGWGGNLLLLVSLLAAAVARADAPSGRQAEIISQIQQGPLDIPVVGEAVLHLPAGYSYLPREPATKAMESMGNPVDSRFQGLVLPQQRGLHWLVVMEYEDSGYVKDDDAKHWNADDLLNSLKKGTEAANANRREHQQSELEVVGWAQSPTYNAGSHQLLWSALARDKGAPSTEPQTINYNTYALGRDGYVSLNLVTDSAHIDDEKHIADVLLDNLKFDPGKRYEDFNASTDHVAAYGLAALVAGVAAKKLGLLAVAGVFILKFFKLIAVAVVAFGAAIKRRLSKSRG